MANGQYQFLFDIEETVENRVFLDKTQKRRGKFKRLVLAAVCALAAWLILFLDGSVSMSVVLDELRFREDVNRLELAQTGAMNDSARAQLVRAAAPAGDTACLPANQSAFSALAKAGDVQIFGHIPSALEWAPLSLNNSCGVIDVLMPDWITIEADDKHHSVVAADKYVREAVDAYRAKDNTTKTLYVSTLLDISEGSTTALQHMVQPEISLGIADALVSAAQKFQAKGLCLNFSELTEEELTVLRPFLSTVSERLRSGGLQRCIVLSMGQNIWQDQSLTQQFDNVVLKAFQEFWTGSPPSPIASDIWFEQTVKRALDVIGANRLTLALGNAAVEWTARQPLPETMTYAQAIARLSDAGVKPVFSPQTGNSFASYRDGRGSHKMWLADAASTHNQMRILKRLGVQSVAVWSLGTEDPGLWTALSYANGDPREMARNMTEVHFDNYVDYSGEGAFLRVKEQPQVGVRKLEINPTTDRVENVTYWQMPRPYKLERYGKPQGKQLVMTFDDGPDERYTPAVLDTLKAHGIPGTFFVVGTRMMDEPGILQRIVDEGHEVGSHTFSHPRMDLISRSRTQLEHNMSARLLAGYTGLETILYREPFMRANGPIEASRVKSLATVQRRGQINAGMDIVPKDWEGWSAKQISDFVISEVKKGNGNVILLHDGGENRQASVDALPVIIRELTAAGYEFTTLGALLGMAPAAVMPRAEGKWLMFDRLSFDFLSTTWFSLEALFWVALIIGLVRTGTILILAHIRQAVPPVGTTRTPSVTVVIPAHNEGAGIAACIRSVLASDYENMDIAVVDDGSMDGTFDELLKFSNNPRVKIYAQLNRGKWSALNAAIAATKAEIVVCIDADTIIDPNAVTQLVKQFSNPRVGAVAGKITVGNRRSLLARLQALEYATAQNFDRRAYDLINGMMVVPGAIGAWRTEAIRAAGRFTNDTMAEDADMTMAVSRAGYRITYADNAIAYTEAPETVRQLLAQRLRWSLGMFQCAWKHKGAMAQGRSLGLFSIPDMLIFGYLFPLLAPIADLFVLVLIAKTIGGVWTGEVGTAISETPTHLIWAYLALPMLDLFVGAYALLTDKREKLSLLLLFPFQRFFYRQLLYLSVYRTIIRVLSGSLAGWGQMRRTGALQQGLA